MKFTETFNLLLETKKLSVHTGSKQEHENLRARFCRALSKHKSLMRDLDPDDPIHHLSVGAGYLVDSGTSTFELRARRGGSGGVEEKDYEIVANA